jgi:adenosylhomocysteine nucleosidase
MHSASDHRATPAPDETLAFVCAMPMELEPITRRLSLEEEAVGHTAAQVGSLGEHRVFGIVTGMGTKFAADGATRLLDAIDVDRVVAVGITGAVENETPIGALVLPELVVDGNTGARFVHHPVGTATHVGTMWTTDSLISDLDEIASLRARGVVALDMETAATAAVCEARGIPWSVFRAISDRATDGSLDDEVFRLSNLDGTPNNEAIERFLAEHPERLEAMVKLAEGAQLAAELAADAAISAFSAG